jgi:hypothetical protein
MRRDFSKCIFVSMGCAHCDGRQGADGATTLKRSGSGPGCQYAPSGPLPFAILQRADCRGGSQDAARKFETQEFIRNFSQHEKLSRAVADTRGHGKLVMGKADL